MKTIKTAILTLLLTILPAIAEPVKTKGTIEKVIVYHGRAMVTRNIELPAETGNLEIIVTDLPHEILSETLHAEITPGINIVGLRYRQYSSKEYENKEINKIEEQIELAQNRLYHAQKKYEMAMTNWSTLDKLEKFAIDAKQIDLEHGLLQAEPVIKIADYIETQRAKFRQQALEFEDQTKIENKNIQQLNKTLSQLRQGRQTVFREALLNINKTTSAKASINLNYLVKDADWSCQYNLRADQNNSKCTIEYNALLHQSTGENWQNVNLLLSTAEPSMIAAPPKLDPMKITLTPIIASASSPEDNYGMANKIMSDMPQRATQNVTFQYQSQKEDFEKILSRRREQARKGSTANSILNLDADKIQSREFFLNEREIQQMQKQIQKVRHTEAVAVTYHIPGQITLPHRSEKQIVRITAEQLNADFVHLATPLLTDYVYLTGIIKNTSKTIFLPGPASAYSNGQFVGNTQMPLVTINQSFEAGFGIDSQIKVSREFEDKKVDTLWGNRIDENHYRLAIHNYKNTPVKLRLFDRLPYTDVDELYIYDFETDNELSKEKEYLRAQRPKGILRWDLNLKPDSFNSSAKIIKYSYTIKYDNNMKIQTAKNQN